MVDETFSNRLREREWAKASKEERIAVLKKWETEGIDDEAMVAEVASRTGEDARDVSVVLRYMVEAQAQGRRYVDFTSLAHEIAELAYAPSEELAGIEKIDYETAHDVLAAESDVCREIGLEN